MLHALLLAICLVGEQTPSLGAGKEMPRVLKGPVENHAYPSWVDARAALTPNGELDDRFFPPESAEGVERLLASTAREGCVRSEYPVERQGLPKPGTLDAALEISDLVILGEVIDRSYGFHDGTPGQLLKVSVSEVLKGKSLRDCHFVFIPIGDFSAGNVRICRKDVDYAAPPDIGDEVFLFALDSRGAVLNVLDASGVVPVNSDGTLRLPYVYRSPKLSPGTAGVRQPVTRSELLERARKPGATDGKGAH